ncbi:DUF106 domain-containing protein [Candidatus Micrarchaeota archaeon]|nr:DUF106 domain-containing protein [Candidatus Micrarchaeota archaeon]
MKVFDAWTVIFFVSLAYVIVSLFLNRMLGARQRLKQLQKLVNDYQKQVTEATKAKDERKLKELSLREKEMMGYTKEMFILPLKSMVVIIPVFFILIGTSGFLGINFNGLIPGAYPDFRTTLPIALHLNEVFSLKILANSVYGSRGFFVVAAIFWGLIVEAVASQVEKRLEKPSPTQ